MPLIWAYAAVVTAGAALALRMWHRHSSPQDEQARRHALDKLQDQFHKSFPNVPELDVQQLQALQGKDKLVLVDVRSEEEQQVSMLPGDNVLTAQEFEQKREQYEGYKVVCYCTAGYRSAQFAERLLQQNVDAFNLRGSILAWANGYQPVTFRAAPLRMLRDMVGSFFAKPSKSS